MRLLILVFACLLTAMNGTAGNCLEPALQSKIVNVLRWNSFWFGKRQVEQINERGVLFRSASRTTIILESSQIWIMFLQSKIDSHHRVLVLAGSGDLSREKLEYLRYLRGVNPPGSAAEGVEEQCDLVLDAFTYTAPDSQRGEARELRYRVAASKFARDQLRHARCPCRYWMPYFDATDPMGFMLIEESNKERYFRGFYWEEANQTFVSVPSPAEAPVYRRADPLTRHLEAMIIKTSQARSHFP